MGEIQTTLPSGCVASAASSDQNDSDLSDTPQTRRLDPSAPVLRDHFTQLKDILRRFLRQIRYRPLGAVVNERLRIEIAAKFVSLNVNVSPDLAAAWIDTGCCIAETAYSHVPYEHQRFIALYSAYALYIDDVGQRDLSSLRRFGQCLVACERIEDPVLEAFALQFREVYDLYDSLCADSINASTLAAVVGCFIEFTVDRATLKPGASGYPAYVRAMSGYAPAYAYFNFIRGWRDPGDISYVQVIPDIVRYTNNVNDILSYYKETLNGETSTYICYRAAVEKKDTLAILRETCEETALALHRVMEVTASDPLLSRICHSYLIGYVEFHMKAQRYRLGELELQLLP
ncbi:terpenoid synthase [Trametes polyzona]|nr:terpenoid synthase [Trametes polyzona]